MSEEGNAITPAELSPLETEGSTQSVRTRTQEEDRSEAARRVTLVGAAFAIIAIVSYLLLYRQTHAWQILARAGGLGLTLVCLALAFRLARRRKPDAAGYWILAALVVAYGTGELMWADATLSQTLTVTLLGILGASAIRPRKWGIWLIVAAAYGACIFLINRFPPLPRYPIMALSPITLLINIPLSLAVLWQTARVFRMGDIRTRLLIAFVLIVLLPATAISATSVVLSLRSGRQQVSNQLESVATLKDAEVEEWVADLRAQVDSVLAERDMPRRLAILLQAVEPSEYETYNRVQDRFRQEVEQPGYFAELQVMDPSGQVVVSTDASQEGTVHNQQAYFQEGLKGMYVQPPFYSPALDQWSVVVARPILGRQDRVIGVLAGRASLEELNETMLERAGLGETGETYLVGTNHMMLTESRFMDEEIEVRTDPVNTVLEAHTDVAGMYEGYRKVPVIGVYHWLPDLQVALVAEQDQSEAFGAIYATLAINVSAGLAAVALAVTASLLITGSIANRLTDLAETATSIAGGDLELGAEVKRDDEIGAVAHAFNSMTAQLREFIGTLEQRVADRTRSLEAAADVAHATTLLLDPDELLRQTVEVALERFGLYYVGLFLVDEEQQFAVLRAGTGAAGQRMLAQGHKLEVGGESMIGQCVETGRARIALDVGAEAVRFDNPHLPKTRSEMALPLRSRGNVIGAMTAQSVEEAAFDETDIAVMQTMADQVAVAIDNARLFAKTQAALEAERRAYGELSREAWRRLVRTRPDLGFLSDESGVASAEDIWRPEMERALREGNVVQDEAPSSTDVDGDGAGGRQALAVPIKVRGQVIGVLDTYKPGDAGKWTSEEIELLETLADQLGIAMESARLYRDAQSRATRERMAREIVDKMRRSTEVEEIVQAAVDELFGALGTSRAFVRLGAVSSDEDDDGSQ
jgi:GAF domain-containing protein/HAMP domain-containing protein